MNLKLQWMECFFYVFPKKWHLMKQAGWRGVVGIHPKTIMYDQHYTKDNQEGCLKATQGYHQPVGSTNHRSGGPAFTTLGSGLPAWADGSPPPLVNPTYLRLWMFKYANWCDQSHSCVYQILRHQSMGGTSWLLQCCFVFFFNFHDFILIILLNKE